MSQQRIALGSPGAFACPSSQWRGVRGLPGRALLRRLPFEIQLPELGEKVDLRQPRVDHVAHFFVREQFLECVAVEQCGALVAEFGDFDFDPVDLAGPVEHPANAQELFVATFHDLVAQRFDDAHLASHPESARVEQAVAGACVPASALMKTRQFEAARWSHEAPSIPARTQWDQALPVRDRATNGTELESVPNMQASSQAITMA